MRRCTQIKCGYYTQGGCMPCDSCKAEPYNINESCRRCIACEGVEGEIRFGDKGQGKEEIKQPKKERLVIAEVR